MMRLIVRHLSGTRATQTDVVPLKAHRELILGRAPSSAVRFDPSTDLLVGRQHARITWSAEVPVRFTLTDLSSRNGTYLNGRRVKRFAELRQGDLVRLGEEGPEVLVGWETTTGNA